MQLAYFWCQVRSFTRHWYLPLLIMLRSITCGEGDALSGVDLLQATRNSCQIAGSRLREIGFIEKDELQVESCQTGSTNLISLYLAV